MDSCMQVMSWSTHDPACSNCRIRKIRCDRQRPQCMNCKRDETQCEFSNQGKRVNHVKLLVNNIGGIETRLINIEKELADLAKKGSKTRYRNINLDSPSPQSPNEEQLAEELLLLPADRHITRCKSDDIDQYHGPCTLFSLCDELQALIAKENATKILKSKTDSDIDLSTKIKDKIDSLFKIICSPIATGELVGHNFDTSRIILPPKQFLVISCTSLFQQDDPAIDLFCQPSFWRNVNRIYSGNLAVIDQPWALAFVVIILLVLGANQPETKNSDSTMDSQFIMPLISTVQYASACPYMLMTPRLINVQALALLSIAAQKYLRPDFSTTLLAQACLLAKRMGLHQLVQGNQIPSEEDEERTKVFQALFLRDKNLCLFHGISCWLPSFDCSILDELKRQNAPPAMTARLQLARLEEETYRIIYSRGPFWQSMSQRKAAFSRIEQSLQQWIDNHRAFISNIGSLVDLKMEFYACRIVALWSSCDQKHMKQVVQDARASCQLLCMPEEHIEDDAFSIQETALKESKRRKSSKDQLRSTGDINNSKLRIRSVVETFSSAAFFALVKNVLWPVVCEDTQNDINLLQRVCNYFHQLARSTQADNYVRKASQTFQNIFTVIAILKPGPFQSQQPRQRQRQLHLGDSLIHRAPQAAAAEPSTPALFPNVASMRLSPPLPFSDVSLPFSNNSMNSTPEFDVPELLDSQGRSHNQDEENLFSPFQEEQSNQRPRYMQLKASSGDYFNQHFFSSFLNMNGTTALEGNMQDLDSIQ